MNEIVNTFLLVGNNFMPEMHLKQPGFTYSDCSPIYQNKERIEKFMQTGNTDIITKMSLIRLVCELHKQIIKKFMTRKVYASFRDNIWGVDLADMQSLSKYNKRIKYLLCEIYL